MRWLLLIFQFYTVVVFSQINPVKEYPVLFQYVQENKVFSDQKKFVDCVPISNPSGLDNLFILQQSTKDFNVKHFLATHFDTTFSDTVAMINHLHNLWGDLTRSDTGKLKQSSLIPLPNKYVVPGGRFRECYYWDSYFTMLGLKASGEYELIESMVDNFAWLIDNYGHIPNGNRTYYLSRSQPPFFSLMVELLAEIKGDDIYIQYLQQLQAEYNFWMSGKDEFSKGKQIQAIKRVVKLGEGQYLNRYYDELNTPRPESFIHDVQIFKQNDKNYALFQNLRAAAESGWDFSSRWMVGDNLLENTQTTHFIPVDLNSLLFHLETTLSLAYKISKDSLNSELYANLAETRKFLINTYCWDNYQNYYADYNFTSNEFNNMSLAGLFPLFVKICDNETSLNSIRNIIEKHFLFPGGLVTTLFNTGQQWDYPNGWAPLQWVAYKSFRNYPEIKKSEELAFKIADNWIALNTKVYFETGKMLEKYNVVNINTPGGGGEYKLQDGFGWTNGVFLSMWNEIH